MTYPPEGYNYVRGGDGDDHIDRDWYDYLNERAGTSTTDDADYVVPDYGKDWIETFGGNDVILNFYQDLADTIDGGEGSDRLLLDPQTPSSAGTYSNWIVDLAAGAAKNSHNADVDQLISIEEVVGEHGDDTLLGNSAANVLIGAEGNDELAGRGGTDTLIGGAGDDTYEYDAFDIYDESVVGSNGFDTIVSAVSADVSGSRFRGAIEALTLLGTADISGIGSARDDVLTGNSGNNALTGGLGKDTLIGELGADILRGGAGDDIYRIDIKDVVNEAVTGSSGSDTVEVDFSFTLGNADVILGDVENLTLLGVAAINGSGNSLANRLTGNGAANTLSGGAGADVITGGGGKDLLRGGDGDDVYVVDLDDRIDEAAAGSGGIDAIHASISYSMADADILGTVENLRLTGTANINGTGDAGNNTINGNLGSNTLRGLGGNDVFGGEGGGDILIGGTGNDTYYVNSDDVIVEATGEGTDRLIFSFGNSTYALGAGISVERLEMADASTTTARNVTGNEFGQTIMGNAGVNTIYGEGGDDTLNGGNDTVVDTLYGGTGDDTFRVYTNTDRVRENTGEGFDRVLASGDFTLFAAAEIEALSTSSSTGKDAIDLTGNAFKQTITGNAGNNVLNSAGGGDTLRGLGGDDFYHVNSDDTVIENTNGGKDTVNAHQSFVLTSGVEVEVLQSNDPAGTHGRNLTGNALAQTITGDFGANILHDGGAGASDIMRGLGGNDIYRVFNSGDAVVEGPGQGTADRVMAAVDYALAADAEVEILTTNGSTAKAAINLTGNALSQEISGNAGANSLSSGGVGGADVLRGLGGNDTYRIYNAGDTIVESPSQGTADRVMSSASYQLGAGVHVEMLTTNSSTATASINLFGNELRQEIIGNAGANGLSDGGVGAGDILRGLSGNDLYTVLNADTKVVESAGQGNEDVVAVTVSYTLDAGCDIEVLGTAVPASSKSIDLTGNEIAQRIIGGAGANRIDSKGGSDTLQGGTGADTFVFSTTPGASNFDTVADFNVADDRFLLSDAIFKALTPGTLSSATFRANTTGLAQDSSDRIIYETDTGKLYYDANGSAAGGSVLFAKVTVGLALTNADFSVA